MEGGRQRGEGGEGRERGEGGSHWSPDSSPPSLALSGEEPLEGGEGRDPLEMLTNSWVNFVALLDRCRRVIELARKYNLLVISDDVYNLIHHDTPPVRLFSYDKK